MTTIHSPAPVPDGDTVARAALAFLCDGSDARMHALLMGVGGADDALRLLFAMARDATGRSVEADRLFAAGAARWGRTVSPKAMASFHHALERWLHRVRRLPSADMDSLAAWLCRDGEQWIIAPHSPCWPRQLDDLATHADWAPPLCLWGRGAPGALVGCPRPIAIVGSRAADEYGIRIARDLAAQAAQDGHLVVSGGAMGVDAAAHWGALSAGAGDVGHGGAGATVAVFAGGLDHAGPRSNQRLFETIEERGGALVSELCPGTVPEAGRFLLRNRLIAALASTVVVTQARIRSGALSTARHAGELNRVVYAVPGDITAARNAGCNRLVHDGEAIIITTVDCIAEICHEAHPGGCGPGRAEPDRTDPGDVGQCNDGQCNDDRCNVNPNNASPSDISLNGTGSDDAVPGGDDPDGDGTSSNGNTSGSGDASGSDDADADARIVLDAIRACRRARTPATADGVIAAIGAAHPDRHVTIDGTLARLAELELRGAVDCEAGCYAIARRRRRRTGNENDSG